MTMNFSIACQVWFRHRYFSNGRLEQLSVSPAEQTIRTLKNHGLFFKSGSDGFTLLYETTVAGQPRGLDDLLKEGCSLRFLLTLRDPLFFNYTRAFSKAIPDSVFYFSNADETGKSLKPSLQSGEFVSDNDLVQEGTHNDAYFVKPFGIIDLTLAEGLQAEYTIQFQENETYWRYVLVGEHLLSLDKPAILFQNKVFQGPETVVLPDKRPGLAFVSDAPLQLMEQNTDRVQLVEQYEPETGKYKMVMRALPYPDVARVSQAVGKRVAAADHSYSEIFIY